MIHGVEPTRATRRSRRRRRRRGLVPAIIAAVVALALVGAGVLWFGHDEGQNPHLYVVTAFVTNDWIYLLEAGGTKEQVDKQRQQISWAIDNFQGKP